MTRIATFSQSQAMLSHVMGLQRQVAEGQAKISSGYNGQNFSEIAEESRRLVTLEAAHTTTERYIKNNDAADGRLQMMETSVSTVQSVLSQFRANLLQALSSNSADGVQLSNAASVSLRQIESTLNVHTDGRYLLGGAVTDRPPVDIDDPAFAPPGTTYPGTADTSYYHGDDAILTVRADDGLDLRYGITAADPAIEKAVRALHLAATASSGGALDTARAQEALRLAGEAVTELPDLIGKIGSTRATLASINASHTDVQLYTEQNINDIEVADMTKLMTRMAELSSTLEASFAVLARIRQLSLADYLR